MRTPSLLHLLTAVLAVAVSSLSTGSAHAAPPAAHPSVMKMFVPLLPQLHRTSVPLLLPMLPSLRRYHASIVTSGRGHYDIFLGYVAGCQGNVCEYGELIGKKLRPGAHRPPGIPVALTGHRTGYYTDFRCGASCGESTVRVNVRGYRYIFGIKAGKPIEAILLTNSALRAGPA